MTSSILYSYFLNVEPLLSDKVPEAEGVVDQRRQTLWPQGWGVFR